MKADIDQNGFVERLIDMAEFEIVRIPFIHAFRQSSGVFLFSSVCGSSGTISKACKTLAQAVTLSIPR